MAHEPHTVVGPKAACIHRRTGKQCQRLGAAAFLECDFGVNESQLPGIQIAARERIAPELPEGRFRFDRVSEFRLHARVIHRMIERQRFRGHLAGAGVTGVQRVEKDEGGDRIAESQRRVDA